MSLYAADNSPASEREVYHPFPDVYPSGFLAFKPRHGVRRHAILVKPVAYLIALTRGFLAVRRNTDLRGDPVRHQRRDHRCHHVRFGGVPSAS